MTVDQSPSFKSADDVKIRYHDNSTESEVSTAASSTTITESPPPPPVIIPRLTCPTVPALALSEMLEAMLLQHQSFNGPTERCSMIDSGFCEDLVEESLAVFIERIGRRLKCSYPCYLIGAVYVQRLLCRNPYFTVTLRHLKRLYGVGVVIAAKYMDDTYYTNRFYSEVCEVERRTYNYLEELFLSLTAFELYITPEDFEIVREIHRQRQIAVFNRGDHKSEQQPPQQQPPQQQPPQQQPPQQQPPQKQPPQQQQQQPQQQQPQQMPHPYQPQEHQPQPVEVQLPQPPQMKCPQLEQDVRYHEVGHIFVGSADFVELKGNENKPRRRSIIPVRSAKVPRRTYNQRNVN